MIYLHSSVAGTYPIKVIRLSQEANKVLIEFVDPWSGETIRKWVEKEELKNE